MLLHFLSVFRLNETGARFKMVFIYRGEIRYTEHSHREDILTAGDWFVDHGPSHA